MLLFGAILFIIQLQKLMNNNINENFTPAEANEALQNIASLYNTGELTVTKLKVTGDLEVSGDIKGSKNLNITEDTFTKNLTTAKDVAIGSVLTIRDPAAPQGKAWQLNNYAGTLMTSSTKSGAKGAVQITDDFCGEGTISTHYLIPGGGMRMAIGTSRNGTTDEYASRLTTYLANGDQDNLRWGYC